MTGWSRDLPELKEIDNALDLMRTEVAKAMRGDNLSLDDLLKAHVQARRTIISRLMKIAIRKLRVGDEPLVGQLRDRVAERMNELFTDRVDAGYLKVPAYGGVHPRLLAYLATHVGQDVQAARLRVLTGEQIHTERRVREFRDLGLKLSWRGSGDNVIYRLASVQPDLDYAARFALEHNIKKDRDLNATEKMFMLLKAELGRPVNTKRLQWISGHQGQYDRRIRELAETYTITTGGKKGSRADLGPSDYILESLEQKEAGESFKAETIQQIFRRDDFRCQKCHWGRDDPPRGGRRYIEAHHKTHKAERGKGDLENGITLCNVCHDGVHAEMRRSRKQGR
jgi:HNH endonuclease